MAVFTIVGALGSASTALAQTVPTVPCGGCGPGAPGDGTKPWTFTEFVCQPQRGFILNFGVGRKVGEPVNFYGGTGPDSLSVVPVHLIASNMKPGQTGSVLFPEASTGVVKVRAVAIGANTGKIYLDNTRALPCTCEQPTTTTSSTMPTTTTTMATTTTTPVLPTSAVNTTTSVLPTSAVNTTGGTLPATGRPTQGLTTFALVLLLLGGIAVAAGAVSKVRKADD